jgi:hypothetical protein
VNYALGLLPATSVPKPMLPTQASASKDAQKNNSWGPKNAKIAIPIVLAVQALQKKRYFL